MDRSQTRVCSRLLRRSERDAQAQAEKALIVTFPPRILHISDQTEITRRHVSVRVGEMRSIGDIERFTAYLHIDALGDADPPEDAHVNIDQAWTAQHTCSAG